MQRGRDRLVVAVAHEESNLTGGRSSITRMALAPQTGQVEEYGIGFEAFEGKLDSRLTFYESSQRFQNTAAVNLAS